MKASRQTFDIDTACARMAALSDPIRLRLLVLIHKHGELCVCEMTHALSLPQPKISKHLAVLRKVELVRMRRNAQWVLYGFETETATWLDGVLSTTLRLIEMDAAIVGDAKRLAKMSGRPRPCASA
jgi:ArsR family transcriptional regulator, arsenate/arsenite/antimonite-responsive transcriptional repressor